MSAPTLQQVLNTFLQIDRSPQTNKNYQAFLSRLVEALGPAKKVKGVKFEDLVNYLSEFQGTVAQSTFAQYTLITKVFFNWCAHQHYIPYSPAAGLVARTPTVDPSKSRAIPTDALDKLIELARPKPRDYAIMLFLADTACRAGGCASLRISRLYLNEGSAIVREKGGVMVEVFFETPTALALDRWLAVRPKVDHDYVFIRNGPGTPLRPAGISGVVKRLAERAGLDDYTAHWIRHWVAESYVENGESPNTVQHKLNHANVKTTISSYFPRHNRDVRAASKRNSLRGLKSVESSAHATNIIPLDDAG